MRCALMYDVNEFFSEQKVAAWGEMQSLTEEPSYKETDLDEKNALYFTAYKSAMDDAIINYNECLDKDFVTEEFKKLCAGSICELLFSLIDEQEEENDKS